MFAGVAASSMPTVHQFFKRQNFSLASLWSSLKSNLLHSHSNGTKTKLPNDLPGFQELSEGGFQRSKGHKGIGKNNPDYDASGRKVNKASSTQIHLTQEILVTQEQHKDVSFRSEGTDYRWWWWPDASVGRISYIASIIFSSLAREPPQLIIYFCSLNSSLKSISTVRIFRKHHRETTREKRTPWKVTSFVKLFVVDVFSPLALSLTSALKQGADLIRPFKMVLREASQWWYQG